MGNFYTNITLRNVTQSAVAAALEAAGRQAFVTPEDGDGGGSVTVYDAECEDQDVQVLSDLCRGLSEALGCVALGVLNHDDGVLIYELWDAGEGIDEYNSNPAATSESDLLTEEEEGPTGGDAEAIAEAFGVPERTQAVEELLSNPSAAPLAFMLHLSLAKLLNIPEDRVVTGYNTIETGEIMGGLNPEKLLRVG